MNKLRDSLLWGIILVVIGVGFLVWNSGVLGDAQQTVIWVLEGVFAVLGLVFIGSYLARRDHWWRLIPGFTLLSVALVILLSAQQAATTLVAAALLGGVALAFVVIYLSDRTTRWWALIPFGSIAVMALLALLSTSPTATLPLLGAVLFGGMALVFLMVYFLAPERQRFSWALVPATALGVMALVALALYLPDAVPALAGVIRFWPLTILLVGVVLIVFAALTPAKRPVAAPLAVPTAVPTAQPAAASGTSVLSVAEEPAPARRTLIERSPISLATPEPPASDPKAGEVKDIYEYLKSAPPEGK
ncbi:MAG: hypothetical protein ABTQ73_04855 [Caldilineales bacterium]